MRFRACLCCSLTFSVLILLMADRPTSRRLTASELLGTIGGNPACGFCGPHGENDECDGVDFLCVENGGCTVMGESCGDEVIYERPNVPQLDNTRRRIAYETNCNLETQGEWCLLHSLCECKLDLDTGLTYCGVDYDASCPTCSYKVCPCATSPHAGCPTGGVGGGGGGNPYGG